MKYLVSFLASLLHKFNLLFKIVAHIATIGFAGGALFLLGFYVIPVFAEKVPHVTSNAEQSRLSAAESDTDGDGLPDYWERKIGSEVFLKDTDGDGISDGLEVSLKKNNYSTTIKTVDQTY